MPFQSSNAITVIDGGMSRELIRLNAPFRQPEWSALSLLEAPQYVLQVHEDFLAAGADVVTTNSYALVPFHIGEERFRERGEELAALAGRLARQAADKFTTEGRHVLVAGSLPPIFGSYEPDRFDPERAHEYLDVLVRGLEPYVDIWLGETLSLIAEAKAVQVATQSTGKSLWIAFTPDDSAESFRTAPRLRSGQSIDDVARWAGSSGIDALLFNCCRPEFMESTIGTAKEVLESNDVQSGTSSIPRLGAYANAFEPRSQSYAANADVCPTDDTLTADAYVDIASQWTQSGATIIGGCCGIGHEHIAQLSAKLKSELSH